MKRKYWWRIGLALLTATLLVGLGRSPFTSHSTLIPSPARVAVAQTPSPSPTLPPPEGATEEAPEVEEPPEALEIPEDAAPTLQSSVQVEDTYVDPGKRFQVGILSGYKSSVVAGVPLFESENGQLAYSVAVRPRAALEEEFSDAALAQVAIDTFRQGEGFTPGFFEPTLSGGARIPWRGTMTMGRNSQPMQGVMLSRALPMPNRIVILMIAATESEGEQVEAVFSALAPTLTEVENQ
ncbi:hypothetical protein K4A83_19370 [Spirulina subsalsa FACHB-351]|uniref:Uncharacterized protein n=1 Tax=Spirulina subsalsa FACHB-351 TaxID=234711 RepID=A0ABT3LAC0_9CYAN|nr:hypothetical protein [Spirulina subsalsa]MCW6038417.1 hypothetical protein [Spirulina subsalsa FACHB-351]